MDPALKQQLTERLRQASSVLVTVSANPSVDQLAAAIGTTLLLNKLNKHATAIFSGTIPSTLEFLQPEKTLEHDIDNLRDFIISLDKAKADKLHFKVEGDIVRIYITPYKTTLSPTDLSYGQGDYNVEVVLALGVANRTQIDTALSAHGRILHDATVIAVTAGAGKPSDVGQINWQDQAASSLCEMMVSISESFGSGLLDAQMATAFLTGIVAETERFRNQKTTPKVMTMSAQLMAAGANQQLIASKLDLDKPAAAPAKPAARDAGEATLQLDHTQPAKPAQPAPQPKPDGPPIAMSAKKTIEPPKDTVVDAGDQIDIDKQGNLRPIGRFVPAPDDFQAPSTDSDPPAGAPTKPLPSDIPLPGEHTLLDPSQHQPTFGSSFSADTQPAFSGGAEPAESATMGAETQQQEAKSIEDARAAVEKAINEQASVPATDTKPTEPITKLPLDKPAEPQAPSLPPPLPESVLSQIKDQEK